MLNARSSTSCRSIEWDVSWLEENTSRSWGETLRSPCSVCLCSLSCGDSLCLSASLWFQLLGLSETGFETSKTQHQPIRICFWLFWPSFQLTLLLERFNRWVVYVVVHVSIVKHFVIGRQAAVPSFVWNKNKQTNNRKGFRLVRAASLDRVRARRLLTLSPSAADLPEHRSLTQPVESLLANQLEQLRLQTLF